MEENKKKKTQNDATNNGKNINKSQSNGKESIADDKLKNIKSNDAEVNYDEIIRNFDDVLDGDEMIEKYYRPNKAKVYWANILSVSLPFLLLIVFCALIFLIPEEDGVVSNLDIIIGTCLPIGMAVVFISLGVLVAHLFYKHTYYVVTNKRILIRTGIFGVDYKSLDLKSVGASDVSVSLFDKILRKNTGSLRFGSNSSPIVNKASYCFAHIVDPYKTYKEIKELIDKTKKDE